MSFQQPFGKRFLGAILAACLILIPAASAFAIDKDQLVQMAKLGLDDKAIIAAIDSSADGELELTKEELGELRLQGVSDDVIEHLKSTGHIEGAAAAAEETPDESPDDGPAPPDGGPAPPADGPAPPSDGPAPAPAEGETEEEKAARLKAEQEREQEILEKAKELTETQKQEEFRQGKLKGLARKLPEIEKFVEREENMEAARRYLEFITLDPPQGTPEWYEAKFGLAKSLYQEGILSGASTPLLEVLLAGADRPHFKEAFYMLEELTREIGYRPPVLEELTTLYIGDMNAEFQNDFNYYMGKFFFDYNKSDLAIEYLQKVSGAAPDFPEALYVMGVARLDPKVNDTAGALKNFQGAAEAAQAEPGGNEEILQLGLLALARTWYEVGLYDVALYYYQKIPRQSGRNAEATFEQAWTYFVKNDFRRALGTFHTLHSPYYSKWYFPDLYVMEAAVYVNLCKFDYAQIAMAKFQDTYLDKQPRLTKYLQETTEPVSYWNSMMTASGQADNATDGIPPIFVSAVLDDLEFFNIYNVVKNLRAERAALEGNIGALGEFGQSVLDRVNEQLKTKVEEGGILVQQKLTEISQELSNWELQADKLDIDITSEEKRQLEQRLRNPDWQPPQADEGTAFLVVADDWQRWEFEGEYWIDEVSNYRSSLRTECVEQ